MILCGASAVQVGTCHWTEGPKCFDRICNELREIMEGKGYTSIDDFRGKLKEWSREGATKSREDKKKRLANASSTKEVSSSGANNSGMSQNLNIVLIVVIGILLADKLGQISI